MRIFLDSANQQDIEWATRRGLIDGVATTPTSLAEASVDLEPRELLAEICRLVPGPVTAAVVAVDADGMYREGRDIARVADNVVVTVPMIEEGLGAARRLAAEGVRIGVSLVFTAAQALFAARAGASFVNLLVGPLADVGHDGGSVLGDARTIFDNYGIECDIMASSIRNPLQFLQSARMAVNIAAVPPDVLAALLVHPLTDHGLDQYLNDWSRRVSRLRASR